MEINIYIEDFYVHDEVSSDFVVKKTTVGRNIVSLNFPTVSNGQQRHVILNDSHVKAL